MQKAAPLVWRVRPESSGYVFAGMPLPLPSAGINQIRFIGSVNWVTSQPISSPSSEMMLLFK